MNVIAARWTTTTTTLSTRPPIPPPPVLPTTPRRLHRPGSLRTNLPSAHSSLGESSFPFVPTTGEDGGFSREGGPGPGPGPTGLGLVPSHGSLSSLPSSSRGGGGSRGTGMGTRPPRTAPERTSNRLRPSLGDILPLEVEKDRENNNKNNNNDDEGRTRDSLPRTGNFIDLEGSPSRSRITDPGHQHHHQQHHQQLVGGRTDSSSSISLVGKSGGGGDGGGGADAAPRLDRALLADPQVI